MEVMGTGRVCYKIKGRNAGNRVIVVGKGENNMVIIKDGKMLQECNIRHLFPTKEVEHAEKVTIGELKEKKKEVVKKKIENEEKRETKLNEKSEKKGKEIKEKKEGRKERKKLNV